MNRMHARQTRRTVPRWYDRAELLVVGILVVLVALCALNTFGVIA